MLTKSGFMLYLQAPMHLWAHKNQQIEVLEPSPYDQYLKEQGLRVEGMATEYLQDIITIGYQYPEVIPQKTFTDGHFQARADLVVYDRETRASDIYEIKSATAVSKIHLYDATFQRLVCEASVQVRDVSPPAPWNRHGRGWCTLRCSLEWTRRFTVLSTTP